MMLHCELARSESRPNAVVQAMTGRLGRPLHGVSEGIGIGRAVTLENDASQTQQGSTVVAAVIGSPGKSFQANQLVTGWLFAITTRYLLRL